MIEKNGWVIVYKKAIQDDSTLLFPERLTKDYLESARRTMGSYVFSNQYQNEVIPPDLQTFKRHWFKYCGELPAKLHNFAFVDPAISEADTADYTGIVIVSVCEDQNWYVRHASRARLNPSQIIDLCFRIQDRFNCMTIGVEDVAYQRALIHFAFEEMKRRGKALPLHGIKRGADKTKQMRILGLVPRFEWGTLYLAPGLIDLEDELLKFPRGQHDDIIDALASLEDIVSYPAKETKRNEEPSPNDPKYEQWYIQQLLRRRAIPEEDGGSDGY